MAIPKLPPDRGYMGDPRRGASLGRDDNFHPGNAVDASPKFSLRRLRLNNGGYDDGGAYWGVGAPLYWAISDDGEFECFFRASNRENAKEEIRSRCPGARFYR